MDVLFRCGSSLCEALLNGLCVLKGAIFLFLQSSHRVWIQKRTQDVRPCQHHGLLRCFKSPSSPLPLPVQAAGVQHAGRPGAPRPAEPAADRPVPGRAALRQEHRRRVAAQQHPDHVLQAAAEPGGLHPLQVRAGERQRPGHPHEDAGGKPPGSSGQTDDWRVAGGCNA